MVWVWLSEGPFGAFPGRPGGRSLTLRPKRGGDTKDSSENSGSEMMDLTVYLDVWGMSNL